MKKLNPQALSTSDLHQMKAEIEKELDTRNSKLQVIEEVKKLAASKGIRIEELFSEFGAMKTKSKRELGPAPIRFRHPHHPAFTWSGRGKRPNWMKDALSNGITEDQMCV